MGDQHRGSLILEVTVETPPLGGMGRPRDSSVVVVGGGGCCVDVEASGQRQAMLLQLRAAGQRGQQHPGQGHCEPESTVQRKQGLLRVSGAMEEEVPTGLWPAGLPVGFSG